MLNRHISSLVLLTLPKSLGLLRNSNFHYRPSPPDPPLDPSLNEIVIAKYVKALKGRESQQSVVALSYW